MPRKNTGAAPDQAQSRFQDHSLAKRAVLRGATTARLSLSSPQSACLVALLFALIPLLNSCTGSSTISKNGLSYIKINDSMPTVGIKSLDGHAFSDSEIIEDGYTWRVCTLAYDHGQVLLESDFQDRIRVNRIRIETPELKAKGGLKVGNSLSDLLKKTSKWEIRPYAKYRLMEVISTKYPRLVFLVKVDGFDYTGDDAAISATDLPSESKVVGIVVL